MAAPTYTTDLNDIFLDGGGTAWTLIGGGRITDPETDDYIQGSSCWSHDPFSSGIEGGIYPSTETVAAGDAIYYWIKCDVAATLATHAAGGMQAVVGSGSGDYKCFYVRGSDDYQYGGWISVPVDPTLTASTEVGTPSTTRAWFGARWNVPGSGASKGYPMKVDAMRHGRQIEVTAGDSGTPATWNSVAAYDATTIRQWGICQPTNSGAALQGLIYWGTATTATYSRDSNRTIAIIDTEWTATDFTQVLFAHASNDVVWNNVGLIALGTSNRGIIDVTANGAITWTNSVHLGIDTTTMLAGSTFDGTSWLGCNEVDSGGGSLIGCQILTPTVATSSYGLLWNVASDPDGELDDMRFSKGTNAHHAIQLGPNTPSSITLRGWTVTGFNAANGNNDSVIYNNSGKAITVNVVGNTGTISYQNGTSATTNIVANPVTTIVTVKDVVDGTKLENARVFLAASDAIGPMPFEESVTIARSGTTATVSHTAHGFVTGNIVVIKGAVQDDYNKAAIVTYVSDNSYSYTVTESPDTPATGTIVATGAIFNTLTDSNGEVSDTRTFATSQNVGGWVRLSTTPGSLYKTQPISGTISNTAGFSTTVQLIPDE